MKEILDLNVIIEENITDYIEQAIDFEIKQK